MSFSHHKGGAAVMSALLAFSLSAAGCSGDTIASLSPEGSASTTASSTRIASVTLSPSPLSVVAGKQAQLTATVKDASGNVLTNPPLSWSTGNSAVATVSSSGLVTGIAAGTARITVVADNKRDFIDVTVTAGSTSTSPTPVPASITITVPSTNLYVGQSEQATAVVKDSSGNVISNAVVTWATTQATVLAVSSSGVALGEAAGSASLSASTSGVSQSVGLTVADTTTTSTTPSTTACSGFSAVRRVPVSTMSQLNSAVTNALPGDVIEMADGVYSGKLSITKSGTASQPIVLCGSRQAIIDAGGLGVWDGAIVTTDASYWTFSGITLRDAMRAIYANNAHGMRFTGMEMYNFGQEAVHLRKFSTHNVIDRNYIHDTGKTTAEYGEGVYIGTYSGVWSTTTGGLPDRSDSNEVRNNAVGPNIGSNHIETKSGVTGNIIDNNDIDGAGTDPSGANWNSAILIGGNNTVVTNNRLKNILEWASEVTTNDAGWAQGTVYHGNTFDMSKSTKSVAVGVWNSLGAYTLVGCDDTAIGTALSNVACK